ncbi:tautomerase family protein [Sessilibacter corallicola]|uniref:Tautomerase family protein n=1 Tax=Sessilibacter corallicola TaxID=2904075 RepID=A0ABQ0A913_9GAMM|nr:tautomerase family protein [Sessilibacter corallicola]MCE2030175.1 tautomerase family protein [Sessilibacter corallicola]
MPLYLCSSPSGSIPQNLKQKISQAITDVHCNVTGAPSTFVHVFFFEEDKLQVLQNLWGGVSSGAQYQLFGNIRSGRTEETKSTLVNGMCQAVADVLDVELDNVAMATKDIEAKWVMEGGDLLPEPGEEAAWLERHYKKMEALSNQ